MKICGSITLYVLACFATLACRKKVGVSVYDCICHKRKCYIQALEICELLGFHSGGVVGEASVLGCDTLLLGICFPVF